MKVDSVYSTVLVFEHMCGLDTRFCYAPYDDGAICWCRGQYATERGGILQL